MIAEANKEVHKAVAVAQCKQHGLTRCTAQLLILKYVPKSVQLQQHGTFQERWRKSTVKSIKKSHNYERGRGWIMAKKAFFLTKKHDRKSLLGEDLNQMVQL